MIVDAHVHLFPDRLAEAIRRWFSDHAWEIRYRIGVTEAVRTLREGGVGRMVALPYAHKPGMARALNDFTLVISREHPEIVPCCTVFPGEEGAEEILEEALAGPFAGVKIHSHVMRVAPDDERLDPVFRACARHQKPLVIHCGREPASEGYGIDVRAISGAARLRRALARRPGIDTAPERDRVLESRRPEDERGVQAAHAVVAVAHDEPILFRLDLRGAPG